MGQERRCRIRLRFGNGTVYVGGGMFSSSQTVHEGEIKGRKTVYVN